MPNYVLFLLCYTTFIHGLQIISMTKLLVFCNMSKIDQYFCLKVPLNFTYSYYSWIFYKNFFSNNLLIIITGNSVRTWILQPSEETNFLFKPVLLPEFLYIKITFLIHFCRGTLKKVALLSHHKSQVKSSLFFNVLAKASGLVAPALFSMREICSTGKSSWKASWM